MAARVYRLRARRDGAARTRARIMDAVRELLAEGTFHEATVEEIAERAGVARATLYQHFGSRLGLIDAICETIEAHPELRAIRASLRLDDPSKALRAVLAHSTRFWAAEEGLHRHLYGLAEVDAAAREFVQRQTADRRSGLQELVRLLRRAGHLRARVRDRDALALLLLLTSFGTYEELRQNAGLAPGEIERTLERLAAASRLIPSV
jgi:AcrR family transcriptional regulator